VFFAPPSPVYGKGVGEEDGALVLQKRKPPAQRKCGVPPSHTNFQPKIQNEEGRVEAGMKTRNVPEMRHVSRVFKRIFVIYNCKP